MKRTLALALLAGPAAAHEIGGAHAHPHLDPGLVALVALGLAASVVLALRRGRK